MKKILMLASLAAGLSAETFTGIITETMCGAKPHTMMKGHTDAECVKLCVKGPYVYALTDGTSVMKLSDQKRPAAYAARKVKVTGTYDEKSKTLQVGSIEPLDAN